MSDLLSELPTYDDAGRRMKVWRGQLVKADDVQEALRSELDPDNLSLISRITTDIIGSCDVREGDMSCAHGEQVNWMRSQEAGTEPHCDAWHAEADGVRFVFSALRSRLTGDER